MSCASNSINIYSTGLHSSPLVVTPSHFWAWHGIILSYSNYFFISFIIKHYIGGVRELAKEFEPVRDKNIVIEAKDKLAGKFASENHAGPKDVADFMDLEDEESIEMTKRDAYEQVQALLNLI